MDREDTVNVGKLLKTLGSSLEILNFFEFYLGDKLCDAEGQRSALID